MSPPHSRPIILLVEDDENDRIFFERAVRKTGFEWKLVAAATGQEAVDYLAGAGKFTDRSAHPAPTHVLLDLKLPELSGIEVLQWIRTQPTIEDLPVIVLSSSREPSDMARAKSLGIDAYEVKPVEFASLLGTVRSIGERWRITGAPVS